MKVPFLDLHAQYFEIQPEVDIALKEFLATGQFIGGEYLEIFETNYANFAINKGKYYWEMKFANNTGGDYGMIGISVEDYRQPDDYPGHDATAWSYYASSGNKYNNGGSSYGDSWTVNDIIGVAFDA